MGVLASFFRHGFNVVLRRYNIKSAYYRMQQSIAPKLREQYYPLLLSLKEKYTSQSLPHKNSRKIFTGWLQGMEQAPELIKACIHSQRTIFKDRDVIVITAKNMMGYVELPSFFSEKFHRGLIPYAMFSDLLRLELLIKYGGTWMDASVLCTSNHYPPRVMECDLFFFQYFNPQNHCVQGISNWFITASSNNKMLLILRDMLYQYWREYDCAVNYYIFHQFFSWIMQEFPSETAQIPHGSSYVAIMLGNKVCKEKKYDDVWMRKLLDNCCFHKLSYRLPKRVISDPDSYYSHVISLAYQLK